MSTMDAPNQLRTIRGGRRPPRAHRAFAVGVVLLAWGLVRPAAAATATPPRPVSSIVSSHPFGAQTVPDVAGSGDRWVAAWLDHSNTIYASRVAADGRILDPIALLVGDEVSDRATFAPTVAWNGSTFLVAWAETDGYTGISYLQFATVHPTTGQVTRTGSLWVHEYLDEPELDAASDGASFLLTWNGESAVMALRVDAAGTAVGQPVPVAPGEGSAPSVAWNGSRYLVAWQTAGTPDVMARRVGAGGAVQGNAFMVAGGPGDQSAPSVAGRPGEFFVAYHRKPGTTYDVAGARVSDAGVVIDPAGVAISTAANHQTRPAAIFDGTHYAVAWQDRRAGNADVYGARVATSGTVLDPAGLALAIAAGQQDPPAVALAGSTVLALWSDARTPSTGTDIRGTRWAGTAVRDPNSLLVSRAAAAQRCADIAFDGTNYFAVWQEARTAGRFDIYGGRVTPTGTLLDPNGIALSTAAGDQFCPKVAWNGSSYLVVWEDRRRGETNADVYMARVSPSGAVTPNGGTAVTAAAFNQTSPDVSANATTFLVAWSDARSSDVRGTTVSPSGVVGDPDGLVISGAAGLQHVPRLAANVNGFMAVWEDRRTGSGEVRATRIANSGVATDPQGIVVGGAYDGDGEPTIAWMPSSSRFLVAWSAGGGGGPSAVLATRLSGAGVVLDPGGFTVDASYAGHAAGRDVAAVGSRWVVTTDRFDVVYRGIYAWSATAVVVTASGTIAASVRLVGEDDVPRWPPTVPRPAITAGPTGRAGVVLLQFPGDQASGGANDRAYFSSVTL